MVLTLRPPGSAAGAGLAGAALTRFRSVRARTVPGIADLDLRPGGPVLVTGGTGCIGAHVVRALVGLDVPVLSLSRRPPRVPVSGVRYLHGDVRDLAGLRTLMARETPWGVVHLAAQRHPSLAERMVTGTASVNVGGVACVLAAAGEAGVERVSVASTGKALRYLTDGVYAGAKKAAEREVASAAARWGLRAGVSRFTHVVDNSIVAARLARWLDAGRAVDLHAPHILLYLQSAREAAQLLLLGLTVTAPPPGQTSVQSLTDLGLPVDLDALTHDLAAERSVGARIVYTGYPAGYEGVAFPGTYGPSTFEASPLVNALEVALESYTQRDDVPVDSFTPAAAAPMDARSGAAVLQLLRGGSARNTRELLAELDEAALTDLARAAPVADLARVLGWAQQGDLGGAARFRRTHEALAGVLTRRLSPPAASARRPPAPPPPAPRGTARPYR